MSDILQKVIAPSSPVAADLQTILQVGDGGNEGGGR